MTYNVDQLKKVFVRSVLETPRGFFQPVQAMASAMRTSEDGNVGMFPRKQPVRQPVIDQRSGHR